MITVYLVRHGEIEANFQKRYAGALNQDLNETGKMQVAKLKDKFSGIVFDKVYCSPLKRTIQTLKAIIGDYEEENSQQNVVLEPEIRERNFGIFENLTLEEMNEQYPVEYKGFIEDWANFEVPSGEKATDAYKRVCTAFDKIISQNEGKTLLLVTHLGCIRYILANKITGTLDGFWHFFADNASVTKVEITDGYCVLKGLNI